MKIISSKGFSLIELMIVIIIICILSTMAIPTYKKYTQRARFSEVIIATQPFKTAISLALQQGATLMELTHNHFGIPPEPTPTKNMAAIKVEQGIIVARSTPIAGDATYILTPNNDGTTWSITGSCMDEGLCNS